MLVGGIAGFTTTGVGYCHVYGCYNSGSCSAKEGYVGGIYGAMKSSYIRGCYSTNSGLYGKSYNYTQPLQNSYTTDILKHKDDMNNELKYWGINYEYVENTDEATKDTMPLVIRKK